MGYADGAGEATMTARKETHENWGGRRKAGPGKRMGRPRKAVSEAMERYDVRLPKEWGPKLAAYGEGKLGRGVRKIIQESGVVG